jgi:hypothetical protein
MEAASAPIRSVDAMQCSSSEERWCAIVKAGVMKIVLFCLSKKTPLLNGLGFSGTSY